MFGFEKLEIWQRSIGFAEIVYSVTNGLPVDAQTGLVSQMRRAAISLSSNLIAGSNSRSRKDFARFAAIANRSLYEVVCQAWIAHHRELMTKDEFQLLYAAAEEQKQMLIALRRALFGGK